MRTTSATWMGAVAAICFAAPVMGAGEQALVLGVTDAGFEPAQLEAKAGDQVKITVTNRSAAAIEFESFELNRERVIQPGQTVNIYVSGLEAGKYEFFDDFKQERRGVLLVK